MRCLLLNALNEVVWHSKAVPFIAKDCPSAASEFAHPDVAIGLTIFSYHFEGLRSKDFLLLLKLMKVTWPLLLSPRLLRGFYMDHKI